MSNELIPVDGLFGDIIPTQDVSELKKVEDLSQSSSFLPRIQLYWRGPAVDKDLIGKAHFGSPRSAEDIVDLGKNIDVLVLVRKAKAIDMSDTDNIIVSNDTESAEFKRIVDLADNTQDSGCAYGPTYLVYERSTGKFYEFFCGNKSARFESSKINTYLPVSPAMIEAGLTDEKEPRGPKPMMLSSEYVTKGRYSWYVPKASDSLTPFDKTPSMEELKDQITKFLKKEDTEVETVSETEAKSKRRR